MSKEAPENLILSSPEEIRRKFEENNKGKLVKLPSGIVVKLKKPDIAGLIKSDVIPSELLQTVLGGESQKQTKESLQKSMEVLDILAMYAVVEPRVVRSNPQEGEVAVDEIPFNDKVFISSYIQGDAEGLKPFRS